jgi:hypothetical protein
MSFTIFVVLLAQGSICSLVIRAALKAFIDRSAWLERPKSQCKAQKFDFRGVVPCFGEFRQTTWEINGLKKVGV